MKDDYTTNSHNLTYTFLRLIKVWENVLLVLGSERVRTLLRCDRPFGLMRFCLLVSEQLTVVATSEAKRFGLASRVGSASDAKSEST